MRRDSGQSAEPGLPPPRATGGRPARSPVIQTLRQDLASLPMQHVAPADRGDAKGQAAEEPKKRRGGWPKGKKRKPPRDLSVPQAPTTGYMTFLNKQKSQLRAEHPDLPFTEITKMLAVQWAPLSREKKQRYIYEADEDRRRYIRRYGSGRCRCCAVHQEGNLRARASSSWQLMEFERDSTECLKHVGPPQEDSPDVNKGDLEEDSGCPDLPPLGALAPRTSFAPPDLCLLQQFTSKVLKMKEFELRELRKTLERARVEQEALQRQLAEFQKQQQRLEVELVDLRTYGLALEKEFEILNMVRMLSRFGLHLVDSGAFLCGCE